MKMWWLDKVLPMKMTYIAHGDEFSHTSGWADVRAEKRCKVSRGALGVNQRTYMYQGKICSASTVGPTTNLWTWHFTYNSIMTSSFSNSRASRTSCLRPWRNYLCGLGDGLLYILQAHTCFRKDNSDILFTSSPPPPQFVVKLQPLLSTPLSVLSSDLNLVANCTYAPSMMS